MVVLLLLVLLLQMLLLLFKCWLYFYYPIGTRFHYFLRHPPKCTQEEQLNSLQLLPAALRSAILSAAGADNSSAYNDDENADKDQNGNDDDNATAVEDDEEIGDGGSTNLFLLFHIENRQSINTFCFCFPSRFFAYCLERSLGFSYCDKIKKMLTLCNFFDFVLSLHFTCVF